VVLGWTSTSNVSEQMQPSCRDKVSGWRLAGYTSIKAGTHYPCSRPMFTGVKNVDHEHGP